MIAKPVSVEEDRYPSRKVDPGFQTFYLPDKLDGTQPNTIG
jgi:hypothetical protein